MSARIRMQVGPGRAVFPSIDRPSKKFNRYECGIVLQPKEMEALKQKLKAFVKDNVPPKRAANFKYPISTMEDGTEFLRSASKREVPVVDVKGRPVPFVPPIGGGSIVRLAVTFKLTDKDSVACYLGAVQLLRLETYGPKFEDLSAEFADGFTVEQVAQYAPPVAASDETSSQDKGEEDEEPAEDGKASGTSYDF